MEQDHQCQCGNKSLTYDDWHLDERLCCVPSDEDCSLEAGDVNCSAGQVIDKYRQSCNGKCWDDEHFGCERMGGKCVRYRDLCHGYSLCEDRSDIKYCTSRMECKGQGSEWDPMKRCGEGKNTTIDHGECYYSWNSEENNGRYDCLDRTDENTFLQDTSDYINESSLITTAQFWYTHNGTTSGEKLTRLPSIACQGNRANWFWCNNQNRHTCFDISLRNPTLCQNHTFWEKYKNETDCNFYFPDGTVKYKGLRCSGEWHHCYSPIYMRVEFDKADTRSSVG